MVRLTARLPGNVPSQMRPSSKRIELSQMRRAAKRMCNRKCDLHRSELNNRKCDVQRSECSIANASSSKRLLPLLGRLRLIRHYSRPSRAAKQCCTTEIEHCLAAIDNSAEWHISRRRPSSGNHSDVMTNVQSQMRPSSKRIEQSQMRVHRSELNNRKCDLHRSVCAIANATFIEAN